jgi:hypothetical protein
MTNEQRNLVAINLTNWLMNSIMAIQIEDLSKEDNLNMMKKLMTEATNCMDAALKQVYGDNKIKVFDKKTNVCC